MAVFVVAVSVGVVRADAEVAGDRRLARQLEALHRRPLVGEAGENELTVHQLLATLLVGVAQQHGVGAGEAAVGDVTVHPHVERACRYEGARSEVPLDVGVEIVRADGLEVGVAGCAAANGVVVQEHAGRGQRCERGQRGVVGAGHRAADSESGDDVPSDVEAQARAGQHVGVAAVGRGGSEVAEQGGYVRSFAGQAGAEGARGLLGTHHAQADVAAPGVAFEVALQIGCTCCFLHAVLAAVQR
mmetsp:Transcript_23365/g.55536  ORF Transcript_23365/g.55536 Transcript_23365/m.55536 type:complete len:244 (-) Transcript_23365:1080-1811(-)